MKIFVEIKKGSFSFPLVKKNSYKNPQKQDIKRLYCRIFWHYLKQNKINRTRFGRYLAKMPLV